MKATTRTLVGSLLTALIGCGGSPGTLPPPDLACPGDQPTLCGALCVDTKSDAKNCGSCGMTCADGLSCVDGACKLSCPKGQLACDNKSCVNAQSDPKNCGACGMACKPGEVCSAGMCGLSCQMGLTNCEGACVDLKKDLANCGGCKMACQPGQYCTDGKCQTGCPMGQKECSGVCVDVTSDPGNCGDCGKACPQGNLCVNGNCQVSCPMGQKECSGVCVSTNNDPANCGDCGKACKQGEVCAAGNCTLSCPVGLENCGGNCTNTKSDNAHCGGCNKPCGPGKVCNAGVCAANCAMGQTDCGGDCADLQSDLQHCGKCGTACGQGYVCKAGTCTLLCVPPAQICDGMCVDVRFNPVHCGGCGKACANPQNGTPACANSLCIVGGCNMDFQDCDKDPKNGCESNGKRDKNNCGGCGKVCAPTEDCCGGCQNVMKDNNNCGACGNVCKQGTLCCGGVCLDPKFSMLQSFNCARPFTINTTQGGEFKQTGMLDQLTGDDSGISTVPANQNPPPAQSPYVWIAMHDSHQVNRVDAKTGVTLGTYSSRGNYPSRVAVALDNSVWVGNRGANSPNNPDISNLAQILPDGTPGCIIKKAKDGAVVPFVRAVAIDGNGFIWFGTYNDRRLHKVDPAKCAVVGDYLMNGPQGQPSYPYGLAVDRNGILWHSDIGSSSTLLGFDVKDADPAKNAVKYAVNVGGGCRYGIVIDRTNNVYLSNCGGAGLFRIDAMTRAWTAVGNNAPSGGYGVTIDNAGDIYQGSGGNRVNKYERGTGKYLASFTFPSFNNNTGSGSFGQMYGIAGDTFGKIWVTDYSTSSTTRFDNTGKVEVQARLPGTTCYNYSDWNAIVLKTVTANNAQAGTWTRTYDSGSLQTQWASATWDVMTPPGTSVAVYFKAANDPADFAKQQSCGPFYTQPVDLAACNFGPRRYLQAIVVLNTNDVNIRPTMSNLKVYYQQ